MPFKTCQNCDQRWTSREAFLADPDISLAGYQPNFRKLKAGYFLFNHACGTTLGTEVDAFRPLHEGPIFTERRTDEDDCPGYCHNRKALGACPAACECAWVRAVLAKIASHPKRLKS